MVKQLVGMKEATMAVKTAARTVESKVYQMVGRLEDDSVSLLVVQKEIQMVD